VGEPRLARKSNPTKARRAAEAVVSREGDARDLERICDHVIGLLPASSYWRIDGRPYFVLRPDQAAGELRRAWRGHPGGARPVPGQAPAPPDCRGCTSTPWSGASRSCRARGRRWTRRSWCASWASTPSPPTCGFITCRCPGK
jgi:hypothetical protein